MRKPAGSRRARQDRQASYYIGIVARPRASAAGAHADGLARGWHGHRGGRRHAPPTKILKAAFSARRRASQALRRRAGSRSGIGHPRRARRTSAVTYLRAGARAGCSSTRDCSLAEINPLVHHRRRQGPGARRQDQLRRRAAIFRHPEGRRRAARRRTRRTRRRSRASEFDLSYIALDGSDRLHGQRRGARDEHDGRDPAATADEPANFLDVGGGATTEKVTEAFKIILVGRQGARACS